MDYAVTVKCSLFLVLLLAASHAASQTPQPKLVSQIDLLRFGLQAPPDGSVSGTEIEVLFLSENRLILLSSPRPFIADSYAKQLFSIDVATGSIVRSLTLVPNQWGDIRNWAQLQRVSNDEFALAHFTGITFCKANLESKQGPQLVGPFQFAPDGSHFVIGPPLPPRQTGKQWREYDQALNQLGSYPEDSHAQMLTGIHGTFFATPSQLRYYSTNHPSGITIRSDVSPVSLALVGLDSVAYLSNKSNQLEVVNSTGTELYRVDLHAITSKLPWNTHLISSASGKLFGAEWTANSKLQLLNPFACIDECPIAALQYFVVFSSADGKLVHSFEWDPRPWNLYVIPALSPDGTMAAVVQGGFLKVYAFK